MVELVGIGSMLYSSQTLAKLNQEVWDSLNRMRIDEKGGVGKGERDRKWGLTGEN